MKIKEEMDPRLYQAARVAVLDVMKVRENEKVLIVTNPQPDVSEISQALYRAALESGARPVLVYQQPKSQLSFAEESVIGAIASAPDVFISVSAEKLGKDLIALNQPYELNGKKIDNTFHYLMQAKKARSFWSPSVTRDIFIRAVPVDYGRMKKECLWVKDLLDRADAVRVVSPSGTDIRFSLRDRLGKTDDGDFSLPGLGGNLPAGETFVSPVVGTAEGLIVYDGSIDVHDGTIVLEEPIRVVYEKGFITGITGGRQAELLKQTIELAEKNALEFEKSGKLPRGSGASYARHARSLGELGIGLNPAARITGNMLEDEKVYETCHFAIGSNYDDDGEALIHLDGLVKKPDITALMPGGGEVFITRQGKLMMEA